MDFQSILSSALSTILAAGLQQAPIAPTLLTGHGVTPTRVTRRPHSLQKEESDSSDSDQAEAEPEDLEFLEDEGLPPDTPAFTGLFRPTLFKSLLHKARLTTNLRAAPEPAASSQPKAGPHDALFKTVNQEKDFIPCPQLFTEVLQTPWGQLGSLTTPSNQDKKPYCAAPELEALLELLSVDPPVASLASPSVISLDPLDGLKSKDRQAELALCKSHRAVAWAIKTATATSFFNRASLIWL